jgi:hypothetical protein
MEKGTYLAASSSNKRKQNPTSANCIKKAKLGSFAKGVHFPAPPPQCIRGMKTLKTILSYIRDMLKS